MPLRDFIMGFLKIEIGSYQITLDGKIYIVPGQQSTIWDV